VNRRPALVRAARNGVHEIDHPAKHHCEEPRVPIPFHCPCGARLQVPDNLAGRLAKCPKCGASSRLPGSAPGKAAISATPAQAPRSGKAPPPRPAPKPAAPVHAQEFDDLPEPLRELVLQDLEPGESVAWAGQAWKKILFWRGLAAGSGSLIFTVAGGGFLAVILAVVNPAHLPGWLYGLVIGFCCFFMVMGVLLAFVLPRGIYRTAANTAYVLTDRRAILVKRKGDGGVLESYFARQPQRVFCWDWKLAPGGGDLVLRDNQMMVRETTYQGGDKSEREYRQSNMAGFINLANVHEVEELIKGTLVELWAKADEEQ
jgi:hypothetical protein